jgi:hypothetical protein
MRSGVILLGFCATAFAGSGPVPDAAGRYSAVAPIENARPNPQLTPGATDSRVRQDNVHDTICVRGYTKTVRPDREYTSALKRSQIARYGYADRRLSDYEEDHLIPLEIGGSPDDPRNLWPQPYHVIGGWGAHTKDKLENRLHRLVCRGKLDLTTAQREIAQDWIAAYKKYVADTP